MRSICLAGCFCLLLLIGGCNKSSLSDGVTIPKQLSRFVLPGTRSLAGVRFAELKKSTLWQKHGSDLNVPALRNFTEQAGINPVTDVQDVVISWDGKSAVAAAEGDFRNEKIEAQLSSRGNGSTYKSVRLFDAGPQTLGILDKRVFLGGAPAGVRTAIDQASVDAPREIPPSLSRLLATLRGGDQIWMVSEGGLPFAEAPMRSDYQSILSNFAGYVRDVAVGVHADEGLQLSGYVDCVSDVGAKRVYDALRGAIGFGRLSTKDGDTTRLKIYDSFNVSQSGSRVNIKADWPSALAEQLISDLKSPKR